MKNSQQANKGQGLYDPETGVVIDDDAFDAEARTMFEPGEGKMDDGSIGLPKITMATIRAMPERCKQVERRIKIAMITGLGGGELLMPPIDREGELLALPLDDRERMTFTALVATTDQWGCVRYDNDGEPEAIFKSDNLFLPIGHLAALARRRKVGAVPIALEFWAQPAGNKVGYSWSYVNLAKLDRENLSPVDRLIRLGVQAGRQLQIAGNRAGLLADLREPAVIGAK